MVTQAQLMALPLNSRIRTREWAYGRNVEHTYDIKASGKKTVILQRDDWEFGRRFRWDDAYAFLTELQHAKREILGMSEPIKSIGASSI